jgi:hypothetical protein
MHTAKIIRHRHKYHHYLNDDLKEVKEETYFKIVFSERTKVNMIMIKKTVAREESFQRLKLLKMKSAGAIL